MCHMCNVSQECRTFDNKVVAMNLGHELRLLPHGPIGSRNNCHDDAICHGALFAHVISCSMYRPCAGAGVTSVYKTEGPAAELFVTVVDSE